MKRDRTLRLLARAAAPATIVAGERRLRVRQLKVGEALLVTAAREAIAEGDESGYHVLQRLAQDLLPVSVATDLARDEAVRVLAQLVDGAAPPSATDSGERLDYQSCVAEYADAYHTTPARVLAAEDWPAFLLGLDRTGYVFAQRQLRELRSYLARRDEEVFEEIKAAARRPDAFEEDEYAESRRSPEEQERLAARHARAKAAAQRYRAALDGTSHPEA